MLNKFIEDTQIELQDLWRSLKDEPANHADIEEFWLAHIHYKLRQLAKEMAEEVKLELISGLGDFDTTSSDFIKGLSRNKTVRELNDKITKFLGE